MADQENEPWYNGGLRFACTQCGNCCTGEPGYVWLNQREVDQLAELLGVTADAFEASYTKRVGIRRSLIERENGDCIFYEAGTGCTVYSHRPRQCRSWPFWPSNLKSLQTWAGAVRDCPGSGRGKLFSVEEILEQSGLIKL